MSNSSIVVDVTYPTGATIYCIFKNRATLQYLVSATGAFAGVTTGCFNAFTEDAVMKGQYVFSENRKAWDDGEYWVAIYKQVGGSASPVADTIIESRPVTILSNQVVEN